MRGKSKQNQHILMTSALKIQATARCKEVKNDL